MFKYINCTKKNLFDTNGLMALDVLKYLILQYEIYKLVCRSLSQVKNITYN